MAVTFDAASEGGAENLASQTLAHTVGSGSNRVLYVFSLCSNSSDLLASGTCSYNGTSMGSAIASAIVAGTQSLYVWRMIAPPTGTANIVITPSSNAYLNTHAFSLSNVDQTTPNGTIVKIENNFQGSPSSLSITVASGGMAIDVIGLKSVTTYTLTEAGSQTAGTAVKTLTSNTRASRLANATAMGWSWTAGSSQILQLAVPVNPASTVPIITGPTGSAGAASISTSCPEGQATVGTWSATNSGTWSLSGTDAGLLSISGGGVVTKASGNFSYATKSSYSFTVVNTNGSDVATQDVTLSISLASYAIGDDLIF